MSNIEHSKAILDAVVAVIGTKIAGQVAVGKKFASLSETGFRWTDAVAPTPKNLEFGKSTTCKDAFTQFKKVVGAKLKAKGRDYGSTAIGAEITDIKNGLMKHKDPELYAATEGNLTKIASVGLGGTAILNEAAIQFDQETATPEELGAEVEKKAEQGARNYLAFIEKNKDALGETYTAKRNAVLVMFETVGYKR